MKLTGEQTKKALECCVKHHCDWSNCPSYIGKGKVGCVNRVKKGALDYINRLEAENRALNRDNDRLLIELQDAKESERKTAEKLQSKLIDAYKKLKTAKAEAIKEFVVRLKGFSRRMYPLFDEPIIDWEDIENLVKEMAGETK